MTKLQKDSYFELITILNQMEEKYRSKIPPALFAFFEENSSKDSSFQLSFSLPLKDQISDYTNALLAMLTLNYWCETEEEKNQLLKTFAQNDIQYQEKLKDQYSIENIFQQKKQNTSITVSQESNEYLELIEKTPPPWYQKLWEKIIHFFTKKGLN